MILLLWKKEDKISYEIPTITYERAMYLYKALKFLKVKISYKLLKRFDVFGH